MPKLPTRILLLTAVIAAIEPGRAQPGPPAPATAAPPVTLEPIRVTADLWASPLPRIAASVSVYDESALQTGAVRHFGDLVGQIPNLTFTGGTSRPRYLQLRGIGENSQYEGETPDSTVRFLIDDFDFTGLGTLGGTFDVQQVEVLRGPQAGAFGANAAGGVVRLVSNAPTPFWTGLVEATAGGDDLRAGGFAVGGPLSRRRPTELMARLSVHRSVSDGYRHNVTLNRATNARDELNARLRLEWNPSAAWRWEGALLLSELDNGFDDFALDNNGRRTFSDQPGRDEQSSLAASLRGTWTGLAGLRFTSVTGVTRVDSTYSYDDDWTAASYQGFSDLRRDRSVASQEFRLDSTAARAAAGWIDRWTLGAYAARTREDGIYTNEDPGNRRGLRTDYEAGHLAFFGQAAHAFDARNRLVVGLRLERLDLDGAGTRTRFRKSRGTHDPEATFRPEFSDTIVGGKVTFEHDLTDRHLLFISATRGYKGGGINVDARINPPADPLTYATEYLWNYEAGLRGSGFGGRLTGEVTAFLLERRDAQVRDSAGFGGNYRFFTANANDARVYGFEAAGTLALTRTWSLHAALARMESSLDRFTLTNGNTGGGRRLANTPRHGYTLGARYRAEAGFFGQAEVAGRAAQFDSNNQNEARRAFAVLNGSIGYAWREWTFTLWGRNLLDRQYENRVFFFGNEDPDYLEKRYESRADPRQIGVTAAYRF
jgi:outer membrane receptor protein involved in Fe transport